MAENKAEGIGRIAKLIDAVHEFSRTRAAEPEEHLLPAVQEWSEKTRTKVERFEFELRTEFGRLGTEWPGLRHDSQSALKPTLGKIVELYKSALNSTITAHTRAMLMRQFREVQCLHAELSMLSRAA
jgi:hypothetical protein